jgi:hypothetical protein
MASHARAQLVHGINPADERLARKRVSKEDDRMFGVVALTWWEQQESSWSGDHAKKINRWICVEMKPLCKLPLRCH